MLVSPGRTGRVGGDLSKPPLGANVVTVQGQPVTVNGIPVTVGA